MKRIRVFIDKQGFFILLILCVGIIVGSGIWAYASRPKEPDMQADASSGYNQRLVDAELLRLACPANGETLQEYSQTAWLETLAVWGAHAGVDLAAETGEAVLAAQEGTVTAAYKDKRWGGVVEISHQEGFETRYCALAWPVSVAVGDSVASGQAVGWIGAAECEAAMQPHLHFELWQDGVAINPALHMMK